MSHMCCSMRALLVLHAVVQLCGFQLNVAVKLCRCMEGFKRIPLWVASQLLDTKFAEYFGKFIIGCTHIHTLRVISSAGIVMVKGETLNVKKEVDMTDMLKIAIIISFSYRGHISEPFRNISLSVPFHITGASIVFVQHLVQTRLTTGKHKSSKLLLHTTPLLFVFPWWAGRCILI